MSCRDWRPSHKTQFGERGPAVDLRAAAHHWLATHSISLDVYFEPTRAEKLARICALGCSIFIDDLVEVLADPAFPPGVERILFDPSGAHLGETRFARASSFAGLTTQILGMRRAA